ncbi:MAG: adventurous gliding motility lipoprotein CglB [Myxococcaceae bacterium]
MHPTLRSTFAVTSTLVVLAGCQTYDFQPVEPLAAYQTTTAVHIIVYGVKPDMMLVVDKSGSMKDPIDGTLPACKLTDGRTCGSSSGACGVACPTRMSELRAAMGGFLRDYGQVARLGLTTFPDGAANSCGAGKVALDITQSEDVGPELQARADEVNAAIQGLDPVGGTPTAATLRQVGELASLKNRGRADFVVLLTDGLPNCNAANPADPATCVCTNTGGSCSKLLCLDQDDTLSAIRSLRNSDIRTMVIGFGADTATGPAVGVLNAMAAEGGSPRGCVTDADCGAGDRCGTGSMCDRKFYQAANAAELGRVMEAIGLIIDPKQACTVTLREPPSNSTFMSVLVNGASVTSGPDTWTYTAGAVVFAEAGAQCTAIRQASAQHPVDVEIRVVEPL